MSKKVSTAIITLLVIILGIIMVVVGVMLKQEDAIESETEKYDHIMAYDLATQYPSNYVEVLNIHNEIVEFLYGGEIRDEQISDVIAQQRNLFSKELLSLNSYDSQVQKATVEIQTQRETGELIISHNLVESFVTPESADVALAYVAEYTNVGKNNYLKFDIIKEDNLWKINSWHKVDKSEMGL